MASDCGRPLLDGWLVSRAIRNEQEGGSRSYVVSDDGAVIGYYRLATGSVMHRVALNRIRRRMPHPIPVVSLGRLAVARSLQSRGIARTLIRDAILRTLQACRDSRDQGATRARAG